MTKDWKCPVCGVVITGPSYPKLHSCRKSDLLNRINSLIQSLRDHSLNPCPKCHIYGITSEQVICDKCRIAELEDFLMTLKDTSGTDDIEMIEKVLKGGGDERT